MREKIQRLIENEVLLGRIWDAKYLPDEILVAVIEEVEGAEVEEPSTDMITTSFGKIGYESGYWDGAKAKTEAIIRRFKDEA